MDASDRLGFCVIITCWKLDVFSTSKNQWFSVWFMVWIGLERFFDWNQTTETGLTRNRDLSIWLKGHTKPKTKPTQLTKPCPSLPIVRWLTFLTSLRLMLLRDGQEKHANSRLHTLFHRRASFKGFKQQNFFMDYREDRHVRWVF